ncbi:NAD-dependent epimerase/dehydratase family protein [Marinobacter sp. VGCF2001]|uniref:NAD-dependent epimerase/dehydratase family protein n=1 Tax=Marinobacter sp. VGCF2001 TaxID=3417189 RepID=UPI003CE91BC8
MKKVCVIGASGSLGRGVISYLKKNHDVTATYSRNSFSEPGVTVNQVDIKSPESLNNLGSDFDSVVMIAGAMPATMAGYEPQRYIDTNITGTLNVLEYCRKSNIKKIIYIMTFSDVSHKFYNGVPIESDDSRGLTLTGDHAVYAVSKVAACDLIEHYHQEYGLQTIIFRIPTVYCADDNFNYYVDGELKTKAYVQMLRSIVSDGKVEVWGNPEHAKDMPYIKDFSRLISLGVEHPTAQGVFNAGTGQPVTLQELVDTMIEVFAEGQSVEVIARPEKPSQPNFTFDMSKTSEVFGFHPEWNAKEMFEDIKNTLGVEAFKK